MTETPTEAVAQLAAEFMDYLDQTAEPDEETLVCLVAVFSEAKDGEGEVYWQVRTANGADGSDLDALRLALELAQAAADSVSEEAL